MTNKVKFTLTRLPIDRCVNNEGQIPEVPANPRTLGKKEFERLKKKLRELDFTAARPLIAYPQGGQYVVFCGNQRLRALREIGETEINAAIVPEDMSAEGLRKILLADNVSDGEWDTDMFANEEFPAEEAEWAGVEEAIWNTEGVEEAEEIERRKREFEERMAAGEISEEDEEYQAFLQKFELKKTTDDCYTPELVYDAVADWVANAYGVPRSKFVRPFYPGGDYKREKYPQGCVVVDNPPFSIISEIVRYYHQAGIKFFLFAPHLTLFNIARECPKTAIVTGVTITYENGANVNTSFVTNMENRPFCFMSCPSLYAAVKTANDTNLKQQKKQLPKYSYPLYVISAPMLEPFSRLGIEFAAPREEVQWVEGLDAQKDAGKRIYGGGYLISDRLFAEREKAEREKAEREKAEREKAEIWVLSERERAIINQLNTQNNERTKPNSSANQNQ